MYGILWSGQLGRVELTFAKTSGAVTGDRENSQSVSAWQADSRQTADYCFHHADENVTTIVLLFCIP